MMSRKTPETLGPMTPVQVRRAEESSASDAPIAVIPRVNRMQSTTTIVECPSENQKPTVLAGLPRSARRRVVLSIAAMWSASNACRTPKA